MNLQALTGEWERATRQFTDQQIMQALDSLDGDFPPSLPAFRKLCLAGWQHQSEAYREAPKALPAPKADKDRVRGMISQVRDKLTGRTEIQRATVTADAGDLQSYRLLGKDGKGGSYAGLYTPKDLELLRDLPRFRNA